MFTSTSYPKSGFAAFQEFISVLQPKDGDREIWLKFGHNQLFVGQWDSSGRFPIFRSRLLKENEPSSRIIEAQSVGDGYDFLDRLSRQKEGGVFFLPGQPIGSPTADAVTSTDDIGIEMDLLDYDEQRAKYQQFQEVTGLEYASLLTSGGKSIHAHLKADRHLPLEQAAYLRRLAVIAHLSDPVTVRLHQPMRIPGFFRKEKGSDQLLLATSKRRYSYDQLIAGFKKWFDFQGWAFPETLPDDFWQVIRPNLTTHKNLTEEQRAEAVKQLLVKGVEGWRQEQTEKRAALEKERAERLERSRLHAVAGVTISDLVVEASKRLGKDAFNAIDHNWQWAGTDKARGRCPFHQSSSGNSGWIGSNPDGLWAFHCYTCTDNKPIDAFAYWLYSKLGFGTPYPRGKQYIELAIEFCEQAGVSVPTEIKEWKPRSSKLATTAGQGFAVEQAATAPPSWQAQYAKQARSAWERSKQFTATLEVEQKFVQIDAGILAGVDVHTLRSTMGTGKTQELARILGATHSGVLAIGYRNSLLLQSCSRWGDFSHLQTDKSFGLIDNPNSRIACCLDSLIYFKPSDFDGRIIVLDEVASIIKHALFSSTLKGKRSKVLELFSEAIKRASLVIAWDGNCCDVVVNYLATLRGTDCRVVKQLNKFKGDRLNVELVQSVRHVENESGEIVSKPRLRDYSALIRKIRQVIEESRMLPEGTARAIAIVSDSQTLCESLDKMLSKDGANVLRLDGKTVREDWARQCLTDPNDFIQLSNPDVVIISPTAESGFDVSIKNYFRRGFAFFFGVIDVDAQCQMLRRFRDCLDWSVWCCEYTTLEEWEGSKSPFARRLQAQLLDYLQADLKAAMDGSDREQLAQEWADSLRQQTDSPHFQAYLQLLSTRNHERSHTRECLQIALENAGHHCKLVVLNQDAAAKAQYKAAKDEVLTTHARQVFEAEVGDLDIAWAVRVRSSFGASMEDEYKAEKIMLLHRLPGVEFTPLWGIELVKELLFEDTGLISRLERWWLLNNLQAAKNKAIEQWESAIEYGAFLGDIRSDYRYLQALAKLDICSLIGRDELLTKDSIDAQRIYQRVKRSKPLQTALRRQPGKEPMAFVGRLLKSIGVTSKSVLLSAAGARRGYSYVSPESDPALKILLECISKRLKKYLFKETAESLTATGLDADHQAPSEDYLIGLGDRTQTLATYGLDADRANRSIPGFSDWGDLPPDCQEDLRQAWGDCRTEEERGSVIALCEEIRRLTA